MTIDAGYGVVAGDPHKATAMLVNAFPDLVIDTISVLNSLGLAERRRARATVVDELTASWLGALGQVAAGTG